MALLIIYISSIIYQAQLSLIIAYNLLATSGNN